MQTLAALAMPSGVVYYLTETVILKRAVLLHLSVVLPCTITIESAISTHTSALVVARLVEWIRYGPSVSLSTLMARFFQLACKAEYVVRDFANPR